MKMNTTSFNEENVKAFLQQKFPGRDAFLSHVLFPVFGGEEKFSDAGDMEMLDEVPELRREAEKVGIRSIVRYGEFDVYLGSVHVFEVVVRDRVKLAQNRVAVQGVVRRLMSSFTGAFMIFHYDDSANWDWRFSFCRKDDRNLTEAKRYTFLLGPNQACRTAAQNFVKLAAAARERGASLDDIVSAFDVEALSREFFKKYTDHYNAFVKYVTGKSFKKVGGAWKEVDEGTSNAKMYADFGHDDKRVRDYVKKLLGRIVFLHFLQKKGWLGGRKGWSDGRPDFMLKLYQEASDKQKGDFLDAVLEPLFSAIDTRRKDDFYDTGVAAIGRVKVPYLNGGLFTRDALDEIPTKFPRDYFRDLLVFLSEYNFTIDENDPNDAEVGVDPEMLGRIFENLLEDNRDKGAYYTPKAIVEYMCRRSLAAYLAVGCDAAFVKKIESFVNGHDAAKLSKDAAATLLKKLKSVRICDPAIGSGAFPMGILREIRLCRETLEDRLADDADGAKKKAFARTNPATLTKEIIENNIYGVDIEKGAVDIARLRFWLALVVDEETPQALPNLDFKIMQGNSLLESFHGIDLSHLLTASVGGGKGRKKPVQATLGGDFGKPVQGELAFGDATARTVITEKMRQYYSESDHKAKKVLMDEISKQVNGFLNAHVTASDFKGELAALGPQNDKFFLWHTWFADVFANGGFDIVIGNPPYIRPHHLSSEVKNSLWKAYSTFEKKADIYVCFMEMALRLLRQDAVMTFIVSDGWLRLDSFEAIRDHILKEAEVRCIVDFTKDVFESATVKTCIVSLVRKQRHAGSEAEVAVVTGRDQLQNLNMVRIPQKVFEQAYKKVFDLSYDPVNRAIKEKVESGASRLDSCFELAFGIKTGDDSKFLTYDPKVKDAKKLIRGMDAGRYFFEFKGEYVIYRPEAMRKNKITARPGTKERYEQPKILLRDTGGGLMGVFDGGDYYVKDMIIVSHPTKNAALLKCLLALLNSNVMRYFYETTFPTLHVQKDEVASLPIRIDFLQGNTKFFAPLVDRILTAKKKDIDADTTAWEKEIDQMFYNLYGFTAAERAIVEKSVKK